MKNQNQNQNGSGSLCDAQHNTIIEDIFNAKQEGKRQLAREWLAIAYRLGHNVVEEVYTTRNLEIANDPFFFSWIARESIDILTDKPIVIREYKANRKETK